MNINSRSWIVAFALLLSQASVHGAETQLSGYIKSYALAEQSKHNPVFITDTKFQSQNVIRLMADVFHNDIAMQFHYELAPIFESHSSPLGNATFTESGNNWRLTDPKNPITNSQRRRVYHNLDRLNIQFRMDSGDLTLGRQAITFGAARFINPSDVFLPFDVRTLNTEYRHGVDAIRFQKPIGMLGELDVGLILGEDAAIENSAAYVQLKSHLGTSDWRFSIIEFAEQRLLATGIESSIGDFGFWLEIAAVNGDQDYWRMSTGLDYSFTKNTFAMLEYHLNDAGTHDPSNYVSNLNTPAYRLGGVHLLGKHYLASSFSLTVTPLLGISIQAIINLDDESAFVSLGADYNIAENVYINGGVYIFSGDDIKADVVAPFFQLGSEYGGSPATAYIAIRYYF